MIRSIDIRNFKTHEDTHLDFHPGINVILGKTGSGKTNILRALLWVLTYRPRGFRCRSRFVDESSLTKVEVVVSSTSDKQVPQSVSLERTEKGMAVYTVGEDSFRGKKEKGWVVPKEVQDALNLSADLNIRQQFDAPFLILSSPPEVATVINRVTRLERVDDWLSDLNSRARANTREEASVVGELSDKRDSLTRFETLPAFEKAVEELEEIEERKEATEFEYYGLKAVKEKIEIATAEVKASSRVLGAEKLVDEALELNSRAEDLREEIYGLERVSQKIVEARSVLKGLREAVRTRRNEMKGVFAKLGCCPFCSTRLSKKVVEKLVEAI